MNEVDLSAFPILRIDQIPFIDSKIILKAGDEMFDLICSLISPQTTNESDNLPPLVPYLQRQAKIMKSEIIKRQAEERVSSLLLGYNAAESSTIDMSRLDECINFTLPSKKPIRLEPQVPPANQMTLPLPPKSLPHHDSNKLLNDQIYRTNSVGIADKTNSKYHSNTSKSLDDCSTSSSEQSLPMKGRPISRNNALPKTNSNNYQVVSEYKNKALLNENFASEFIVAATHKRIRFYPKKSQSLETEEQIKIKEKTERRKAALSRLISRREARQEVNMRRKQQKLLESAKSHQLQRNNSNKSVPLDDRKTRSREGKVDIEISSCDSESISGGDDDISTPIGSESMIMISDVIDALVPKEPIPTDVPIEDSFEAIIHEEIQDDFAHSSRIDQESINTNDILIKDDGLTLLSECTQKNDDNDEDTKPIGNRDELILRTIDDQADSGLLVVGDKENQNQSYNMVGGDDPTDHLKNHDLLQYSKFSSSQPQSHPTVSPPDFVLLHQSSNGFVPTFFHQLMQVDMEYCRRSERDGSLNHSVIEVEIQNILKYFQQYENLIDFEEQNCQRKQLKLLKFADEMFVSLYEPNKLPGLRAWTSVSVVNTNNGTKKKESWKIDFDKYKMIDLPTSIHNKLAIAKTQEELTMTILQPRKTLSFGLVILVINCEEILLGSLSIKSESQFLELWGEKLAAFDEKAHVLSEVNTELLFRKVTVCEDCYTICKKVEKLLKMFLTRNKYFKVNDEMEDVVKKENNPTIESSEWDRLKLKANNHHSNEAILEEIHELGNEKDNEMMKPTTPLIDSVDNHSATVNDEEKTDLATSEHFLQHYSIVENKFKSNDSSIKLKEFYPHFGSIFPACSRRNDARSSDSTSARLLLEAMQIQVNVYEEWMDIMSDYSTVFSDERKVNEYFNQFNSETNSIDNHSKPSELKKSHSFKGRRNDIDNPLTTSNHRSSTVYKGGTRSLHFRVKSSRPEVYNIVNDVFNNSLPEWEELPVGLGLGVSWNVLWTWSKPRINPTHLLIWQKMNHFEDSKQLTRKDLLKKNLQRFTDLAHLADMNNPNKSNAYSEFEILPQTFILPQEYTQFVQAFTEISQNIKNNSSFMQNYWIMKPIGLSRGRGISVIRDLNDVLYSQSTVIQKYVENPLCLGGYKFDLRLYVLVTSFKPLEAFIYKDGFARVSTHQFTLDPNKISDKFIHLTNSSIQKQNPDGASHDNPLNTYSEDESSGGSKISLLGKNGLWERLERCKINVPDLWNRICSCVLKSLVAVDEKMVNQLCSFELFGYDVLIDTDLRPWLIEVNASPSLARENALDHRVKSMMIKDIIVLLDPAPFDRGAVARILRRRFTGITKSNVSYSKGDTELEKDLQDILGNYIPRKYGEMPKELGSYEMIAPSNPIYHQILKLKRKIIKS